MRCCWGLVSTTSADGPADSWAAVCSISLELVHAPSASAVAAARTATRGPRRMRVITGPSPSGRAHGRAPLTGGGGGAVRGGDELERLRCRNPRRACEAWGGTGVLSEDAGEE